MIIQLESLILGCFVKQTVGSLTMICTYSGLMRRFYRPVLLILDNHVSHLSIYAIDAARENGVDLLFFPSHSSHLLQLLDVVYFHALKQKVADISVDWG